MKHNHCVACGAKENLHQHHLVPRSLGGSDDESNLLTLCGSCHAKAHHIQADWRHSELTSNAIQAKKARGELFGVVPYGFRCDDGVNLVKDAFEQEVIVKAKKLRYCGLSFRKIAGELKNRGIVSRNGKKFHATSIQRMLANGVTSVATLP